MSNPEENIELIDAFLDLLSISHFKSHSSDTVVSWRTDRITIDAHSEF